MLSGFSPHALNQLADNLGGGGGGTVVVDFGRLADEVAALRMTAARIANALENPTWAAGDEMCRRSASALENGWYEDARADAARSIEAYPYRAAPHLFLAISELNLGDAVAAHEALKSGIKYGRAQEAEHAATAGLLAANLALGAGSPDAAMQLILDADAATHHLCPALVVAALPAQRVHSDDLVLSLRQDPSSWNGVDLTAVDFGPAGRHIERAFDELVAAAVEFAEMGEVFSQATLGLTQDHFELLHNYRDDRPYSGAAEALAIYSEGGLAQLIGSLARSVAAQAQTMSISQKMTAGVVLLRHLTWRQEVTRDMIDAFGNDYNPDSFEHSYRHSVLDNAESLDALITDWSEVSSAIKFGRPIREVGVRGMGVYIRALRARQSYERAVAELRDGKSIYEQREAPRGMFVSKESRLGYAHSQKRLAAIDDYLSHVQPPPDTARLSRALRVWVEAVKVDNPRPGVRPFVSIYVPPILALN